MPKSKHGKGKRFQQVKRNQPAQQRPVAGPQAQPISTTPKPVAPAVSPAPAKPVSGTVTLTSQSSYIIGELQRIGILTGIIVVILIILAFTLT
jgi:hypothetical protein